MFNSKDPAMAAAGQLAVVTAGLAGMLQQGFDNAIATADSRRERRAARKYADDLDAARGRADELGHIAIEAVRDLATAEGEIRRLRAALCQRQAYIDRLNSRKVFGE